MTVPQAILGQLHRADGSADYSHNGYRIVCAVNGPIEVQRRDELPDEAAIEVNVRPATGIGGPRERHIESTLQTTLRHIILTHMHPRTLVQITLQILALPPNSSDLKSPSVIPLLAPLLNAAVLALLSASIPLLATPTATTIAFSRSGTPTVDPSPLQLRAASSAHVFAFDAAGSIILAESDGSFYLDQWREAERVARRACLGDVAGAGVQNGGDVRMADDDDDDDDDDDSDEGGVRLDGQGERKPVAKARHGGLLGGVEGVVGAKIAREQAWRSGT